MLLLKLEMLDLHKATSHIKNHIISDLILLANYTSNPLILVEKLRFLREEIIMDTIFLFHINLS